MRKTITIYLLWKRNIEEDNTIYCFALDSVAADKFSDYITNGHGVLRKWQDGTIMVNTSYNNSRWSAWSNLKDKINLTGKDCVSNFPIYLYGDGQYYPKKATKTLRSILIKDNDGRIINPYSPEWEKKQEKKEKTDASYYRHYNMHPKSHVTKKFGKVPEGMCTITDYEMYENQKFTIKHKYIGWYDDGMVSRRSTGWKEHKNSKQYLAKVKRQYKNTKTNLQHLASGEDFVFEG